MAYEVPPLPYDYNALEPHIDEQTMRLHHDKHHQAYVTQANGALEGTEWADRPVWVRAELRCDPTPEAAEHGVWCGSVASDLTRLEPPHGWLHRQP